MSPPKVTWEMNLNTLIMVLGFVMTLAINYGAYTAFKAETTAQLMEQKTQRAADVVRIEARTASLETEVRGLALQDARQIEQISAMLAYLQRIERTLDTLVKENRP